jgi:uncharacterized membrane protein
MFWKLTRDLFALGVVATVIILALVWGPSLPGLVPSHFDLQGNVDHYMPRTDFLLMIVGVTIGLYLGLTFVPFIDPFWKRVRPRYHVLMLIRDFILGFVLVIFLLTLFAAPNGHIPVNMLGVSLGVLFALIGNYLPKVPRNWFFGIRTPWTLVSDTVWQRSHVVGGWMFVVSGVLTALLSLVGVGLQYVLLPTLLITVVVSGFVYPFLLQRHLQHDGAGTTSPRS